MTEPTIDRPLMPNGYGVPDTVEGTLTWAEVTDRLVASLQYWMATTRPDHRPHVVPRWGVWIDDGLYYDGAPTTRHVQNLRTNPACVLHLEDGWQAVTVEGTAAPSEPPGLDLGTRIAQAIGAKYGERGYTPEPDAWESEAAGGLVRFTPTKAMAWFDFPNDVTRFRW